MNNEQWEINYKNGRFNRYPFDSVVSFVYSYFGKIKERSAVKILDLGCGGGNHAEFIDKEGFSYYGVDGSNTSVILTREKLDVKKKDRVINTDFRSIPFDDNCFDAIIDRQSLGHNTYNDIKIIVSQIYRVLKIGGYWFCQFFSVNHPDFKYGQHIGNNDYVRFKKGNFAKSGIVHAFDLEQIKNIFSNFSIEYALKIRIEDPIKGVLNSEMWEIVLKK